MNLNRAEQLARGTALWLLMAAAHLAQAQTSLIVTGSVWNYLADGTDQGTIWREPGFNDGSWPRGAAEIGFGDGDEATNLGTNRMIISYYFRQTFQVADPASFSNLVVRLRRDDGVVAYLNGVEVFRSNMPEGEVTYQTVALQAAPDDGDALIGRPVPLSVLMPGPNVLAAEVHQNSTNSSDISFDLELTGNFDLSQFGAPTVSISSPTNGATIAASSIPVALSANDADGGIASVEVFVDDVSVGADATAPFSISWSPARPGIHRLHAVATDIQGLAATSAPVTITVQAPPPSLVPFGATWKYLGDGSDQGSAWKELDFDDSAWLSGPARLGFGGDGEVTTVGSAANGFITYYFRHAFTVTTEEIAALTNLSVVLQRDDGAIVYLNGAEIFRSNMPEGPVTFTTLASSNAADDGDARFTNRISTGLLMAGVNVIAVEVHQNDVGSSDLTLDLAVIGNIPPPPPVPPAVTLTSPANNATLARSNITLNATATDADGTITQVRFFQGNVLLATDPMEPYSTVWMNVSPGQYTLSAVATDSQGLMSTSAPVNITVVAPPDSVIPFGSTWRYLDDGSDPGTEWASPFFSDSSWLAGAAELGFGDGDEATLLRRTNSLGQTNITYYFRRAFEVGDLNGVSNLVLRLVRDDGAIVYLNGVEILRDNLPSDSVSAQTLALNAVEDEPIISTNLDLALLGGGILTVGENLIAVEIHQQAITSSDVSFDLQLRLNVPPTAPAVTMTAPTNGATFLSTDNIALSATASDVDGNIERVEFFADGVLIDTPDQTFPYGRTAGGLAPGQRFLTAVATDNSGLSTTSAPVQITVLPGPLLTTLIATGSVWRYFDAGTDLGTAWREADFDDRSWLSGPAELGFGDGDEATVLTPNPANISYYFRQAFEVTHASAYTNLAFRVRRDDGVVVYLNGAELFRMNMPGGPITVSTPASGNTASETIYFPTNSSPAGRLREGRNVLAAEVHQSNSGSSDISFDLELIGQGRPRPAGPVVSISIDGSDVVIRWTPEGGELWQADDPAGPYLPASINNPHRVVGAIGGSGMKFYQVRQ